jgi:hypothetical protein
VFTEAVEDLLKKVSIDYYLFRALHSADVAQPIKPTDRQMSPLGGQLPDMMISHNAPKPKRGCPKNRIPVKTRNPRKPTCKTPPYNYVKLNKQNQLCCYREQPTPEELERLEAYYDAQQA